MHGIEVTVVSEKDYSCQINTYVIMLHTELTDATEKDYSCRINNA